MITGELKSQVDKIWEAFWTGGIYNPLSVIEQFTYLLFIRRLDERQLLEEKRANTVGIPIQNIIFTSAQKELRWSSFKNKDPESMFEVFTKPVVDNMTVFDTKDQFVQQYGEKPLGAFIRSITGVEQAVLNEAFADFLQVGNLRADQMTFINTIISYLTKNGTIDKSMLYQPPFTDLNDQGLSGVFDEDAVLVKVVKIIDEINENARKYVFA